MTSQEETLKSILAQMESKDAEIREQGHGLTQDQLNDVAINAHLTLNEELSMEIIRDIHECLNNEQGWSLVLCGARALRSGLENDHGLLNRLKSSHSDILNELAGDVVRVGFSDSPFKTATVNELKSLCMLFRG